MWIARIFMRSAGMRHSAASRSISDHSAFRSSPGRTNVRGARHPVRCLMALGSRCAAGPPGAQAP
jgi:hypothetical protein